MSFRRSKVPKFIPIISLLILLVLGPIVFSFLQNARGVEAAWVDDNFSYRNAIPITSHTAAESNVYISATIDTSASGQFQSDCGDLRFTTVGGDILPYYIVSGCVSASTVVHVFFKSMPAGAQTIYYYYGNPSAANGFSSADFATQASSYALGSVASQEKGGAPILHWKLDEGTGTTTKDSTTSNLNGTVGGSVPPTWQPEDKCISGKCLYFDSSNTANNGKVVFNETSTTKSNIIGDVSISLWAKPMSNYYDTGGAIIRNGQGVDLVYSVFYDPVNQRPYFHWYDGSFQVVNGLTNSMPLNQWSHVAITRSGTNLTIYVNGKSTTTATVTAPTVAASQFALGQTNNDAVAQDYNGYVDDVKVYNYARTAAQIKSDFKSRGTAKGSSASLGSKISDLGSLSNGLVGYWKMDEVSGAGSTLADSSGNSNTGTAVLWGGGNTSTDSAHVAGKYGNSFSFDGGDDYFRVEDSSTMDGMSGLTMSVWLNPTSVSGTKDVIHKDQSYEISIISGVVKVAIGTQWAYQTGPSITAGIWTHITSTWDGSTLKIFKDGELSNTYTLTSGSIPNNSNWIAVGGNMVYLGTYNYPGKIDEVRIYNRALSPREVRDLYNWAPGPVGYWNFEEKSGANAYDTSGNSQTGTINGNPTWIPSKYTGAALNFDGTGDYVSYTLPSTSPLKISGALTLSYWMNTTTGTSDAGLVGTGIETGYQCTHHNGATLYCYISSGANGITATLGTGTWKYISFTWDGTTGTNGMKLYIDGVLTSQRTSTVAVASGWTTLQIGKSSTDYNGKLDDVKIYNYVRTQKQIVEDMNAGHPVGGSPVGSQVGYWKMDEGYGSTVSNSGNGVNLNGTITGATWNNNGKFSKALSFDGSGDTVALAGTSALNIVNNLTLSAWINPSTLTQASNPEIIAKSGGAYFYRMRFLDGGKVRFNTYGASDTVLESTATLVASTWTNIVMTYDGQNKKIYLNGKLDSSEATTGDMTSEAATTLNIGSLIGGSESFNGLIDEVKIYNSALTSDEIQIDYNRGQAMVLGTLSDTSGLTGGSVASSSASAEYCIPGDTATCTPPVGEWNFEEGSGNANDTSGNGNTGTPTGTTIVPGKIGKARSFNGSSDYVSVTDNSSLNPSTFTIELWAKKNSEPSDWGRVLHKTNGSNNGWTLLFDNLSTKKLYLSIYNNAGSSSNSNGYNTVLPVNTWRHYAWVFNGSTITTYENGILLGSPAYSGTYAVPTATNLYFASINGSSSFSPVSLDSIRLFNYARTPAQVAWDYNRGGPVGHWRMDECQGATAKDSSGNGNNGTITIGATGTQTAVGTCTTSGTAWYNGVTGKFNSSLNFDGTDDYVQTTGFTGLASGGQVSMAAWVKPTLDGTQNIIIDRANQLRLEISSGNVPNVDIGNGTGWCNTTITGGSLTSGQWAHLSVTYDNATAYMYVNGVRVGTPQSFSCVLGNSGDVYIGRYSGSTGYEFPGQIDDVRIYNYALTPLQVKTLYNGGAAVKFAPLTGSP